MGAQARDIMMRSMYDRQPYESIAEDLGISRDTVGRTVRRWRGVVEKHI
jgi:DNA-directed RNA polymerase specialized sigma24 family protein